MNPGHAGVGMPRSHPGQFFQKYLKYIVLALLMYMPIFGNLNILPIRDYDEGTIAVNACEMYQTGELIVTSFKHGPEMWNTKPPLLIWLQVALMKLIGVNELAIRLPSAFAAFFTCLALLLFSRRYLRSEWTGYIAVLVLITTNGYIHYHASRTGDYDALLAFFTTVSCLLYFAFCETDNTRYLYLFFGTLACAVLTKGVAGLLFTPALLIYTVARKQLLPMLRNPHFYAGLATFAVPALGYYLLREVYNPGYIAQVQENELGGRYLDSQGGSPPYFWFYFEKLATMQMADRYILIPCGILVGLLSRNPRLKRLTLFMTLLALTFFLVISAGHTQMEQYDIPMMPFLALLIAVFIHTVFSAIMYNRYFTDTLRKNVVPYVFLFLLFLVPYQKIWAKTYTPAETHSWDYSFYEICYFFQDAMKGDYDLGGTRVLYEGYDAHILFYVYALNDLGQSTSTVYEWEMKPGDTIIAYQDKMKQAIRDRFVARETAARGQVSFFTLVSYR